MEFSPELQDENVNLETVSIRAPVASQQEEVLKLKSSEDQKWRCFHWQRPQSGVIIQGAPVVP